MEIVSRHQLTIGTTVKTASGYTRVLKIHERVVVFAKFAETVEQIDESQEFTLYIGDDVANWKWETVE